MKWGDGFITNGPTVKRYNLSNPSAMFAYEEFKKIGPLRINKNAMPNQASCDPTWRFESTAEAVCLCYATAAALAWPCALTVMYASWTFSKGADS